MSDKPIRSKTFMRGDNSPVEFLELPDPPFPCVICNAHGMDEDRIMALLSDFNDTAQLECLNCGHTISMRTEEYHAIYDKDGLHKRARDSKAGDRSGE